MQTTVLSAELHNQLITGAINGDYRSKENLIKKYSGLISSMAYRSTSADVNCPPHISKEDIYQDGVVELLSCLRKYKPNQGAFAPWFYKRMKSCADESLRKACAVSVTRSEWRSYKKGVVLGKENCEIPFSNLMYATSFFLPVSTNTDGEEVNLLDALVGGKSPEEEFLNKEVSLEIYKAISTLSDIEKKVIVLSFGLYNYPTLNNNQIGKLVNRNHKAVSNIKKRALERLSMKIPQSLMWTWGVA